MKNVKSDVSKKLLQRGCSKNGETVCLWKDGIQHPTFIIAKTGEETHFTNSLRKAKGIFDVYLAI